MASRGALIKSVASYVFNGDLASSRTGYYLNSRWDTSSFCIRRCHSRLVYVSMKSDETNSSRMVDNSESDLSKPMQRDLNSLPNLSTTGHNGSKVCIVRENVEDTALAAQYVANNGLKEAGVITGVRAAKIYELDVLVEQIQDDPYSVTRFLILARDPIIPRTDNPFKTSVVFSLEEGPGMLFKALAVFALREINLTKMESWPQRKKPLRVVDDSDTGSAKYFDYLFYIDFEASMADPLAQNALARLQELNNE